jgi:hypothetical protein
MLYRGFAERARKEELMPTNRELELDRLKRLDAVEKALNTLTETIKRLEEKLNEREESKSAQKVAKVSSK